MAQSNGAFEPWASKTDPSDVTNSYVQDVATSPFTYHITQGGTMDGKMCTTLPGVWEPYEQTWESSRSIRMENVGATKVINPWLKLGPIDFFSQQTIADSVVQGLSTEREKALAIFYFYITHRYHKGNGDNTAQGDVSQAINVFGFNTCGNSTLCLSDLLDKVGMRDCIFSHCPGHVAPQVFFDGRYHTLDGDMATFMLLRDNHTLANELELVRDHDLIKRVHQYGIMSPVNPRRNNEDYAQYYTWEGNTTVQLDGWAWWNMGMVLRPHEAIEWRWGHGAEVKYHGDMTGHPPTAPDTIYNGLWEYVPDFRNDSQWRDGASATNIISKDGVLTATEGMIGTIVWPMKTPYQFVGGGLPAVGEGYVFEVGFVDPKDWRKISYTPVPTSSEFDTQFRGRTADAREYWLKCTLSGKASLRALRIQNDIQMAPLAMPSMSVGTNMFTYLEHTDEKSGANSGRNLRITHTWVERSATRPPNAPNSAVYPANGGDSDGTDVAFEWTAAIDPDGDAIADYHFQLSDRPDMRWPMSPNFDKYISRTPDKGQARYTLPRPGLLTPGKTYYWHVKAKDAKGVWGPWSRTWSFTAQGPDYPVDVALKLDPGTGIGTLTWKANASGRHPAKFRVYGSDEKGFTVHDAPYDVNLGDTKELANPFPANFVAEITANSLEVIGAGNPMTNANKAYYRVVAVDRSGKRSGDSDYVEAPRPFIYTKPVTNAPVGQPYRYHVKAIRSLGDLTRRDAAQPKPGAKFWKIEPLKFALTKKPSWMSVNPDTGLITGTSDGTGGTVTVSVSLTKEHRLVHDKDNIMWGNEHEQSRTYETVGPVLQQFVVDGTVPASRTTAPRVIGPNIWLPSTQTVPVYTQANPPPTPKLEDLPLKESVSQYGIVWTFDKPARVGQFVNGDWYVVGPVTVTAITPKPLYGAEIPEIELDHMDLERPVTQRVRNGFMLNPPASMRVSYDSGVRNWFDPSLIQRLPVAMSAGDSLVSTISMPKGLVLKPMLWETVERGVEDSSPIRTSAVLTCVSEPLPPDTFRPAFCDRRAKTYTSRNLKRELLPTAAAKSLPDIGLFVRFTERPWVGTGFFGFESPVENMPQYGRDYARVVGQDALLLCTDLKPEKKEALLVDFVQVGIDLGGMIRWGHPGWEGFGGHGSGRKLPIVFAGLLLGDDQLAHINKSFPNAHFGEDEQTAYGDAWTGAKVVFTGHRAIDQATGVARDGTGPYEHTPPSTWGEGREKLSESYRRCCTSAAWVAEALALRLMKAESVWDHDAFFDYCDRWMYENETEALNKLKQDAKMPQPDWAQEGKTWEAFVNDMWTAHRTAPGMPPTDGWKKQHDDSYLKTALEKAQARHR